MAAIQRKKSTVAFLSGEDVFLDHGNVYLDTIIVILGDSGGEILAKTGF